MSFQLPFSSAFVSGVLGGPPGGDGGAGFSAILTDSRKAAPGALFVALEGEKLDGHDFILQAVQAGCAGVVCRRDRVPPGLSGAKIFAVDDTLRAFRALGAAWRKAVLRGPLAVVAGSVGKTTTKELLAAALGRGRLAPAHKTTGSLNGFVGIPITLLELTPEHASAVIEVGIDEPGAMARHLELVAPDLALVTAVAAEHLEKLGDIATVAREECLALHFTAARGGKAVVALDDPWIRPELERLPPERSWAYTLEDRPAPAGVTRLAGRLSADDGTLHVQSTGMPAFGLPLPLPGRHNAANLLAATASALALGLGPDEIRAGLQGFQGAPGRSELVELPSGTRVLCDYYNSSPISAEAGLTCLAELARRPKASGRRLACLGDMLELGPDEEAFHRALAERADGLDQLVLYGPRMKWLEDELRRRGFRGRLSHEPSHEAAARALQGQLGPGDALLIKGSRGMRMEEVWKLLKPGLS